MLSHAVLARSKPSLVKVDRDGLAGTTGWDMPISPGVGTGERKAEGSGALEVRAHEDTGVGRIRRIAVDAEPGARRARGMHQRATVVPEHRSEGSVRLDVG